MKQEATAYFPFSNRNIQLPIFSSTPFFDVGMPVVRAIRCFTFVIPTARFHEKVRPGMGGVFLLMIRKFHLNYFAEY